MAPDAEAVVRLAYEQALAEIRRVGAREPSLEEFKMRALAYAQAGDIDGAQFLASLARGPAQRLPPPSLTEAVGMAVVDMLLPSDPAAARVAMTDPFAYARPAPRRRMSVEDVRAAGGYAAILADCPWPYDNQFCYGGQRAAAENYDVMSLEQLKALPVAQIAAADAALFLWATYPFIQEALDLIPHWGFLYKSYAFDWVKLRGDKPQFGLGQWFRGSSEVCLLAVRGKPERRDAGVRQLIETMDEGEGRTLRSEAGRHSAKPAEVRARIERLLGDVPRIELFARERASGWDAWGNEVESDIEL